MKQRLLVFAGLSLLLGCEGGSEVGVASVAITPAQPTTADALVAQPLDAEGLPVPLGAYVISWRVDGVDAGASELSLGAAATTRGEVWEVALVSGGATVVSPAVTIANAPPSISEVQLSPAEPRSDEAIEALVAGWTDADGDAPGLTYEWMLDGSPLDGATGSTLEPGLVVRGDEVSVRVTPNDGMDSGPSITSPTVIVANGVPYAPSVAITPSEPNLGVDDLLCSVADGLADPDGDACTYDVRWIRDGIAFPDAANPGGAEPTTTVLDGDTVPASETQGGQNWTCRVVANDGSFDSDVGEASLFLAQGPMPDFDLVDVNATSPTTGLAVSPRDYLAKVSGWYFGHST